MGWIVAGKTCKVRLKMGLLKKKKNCEKDHVIKFWKIIIIMLIPPVLHCFLLMMHINVVLGYNFEIF